MYNFEEDSGNKNKSIENKDQKEKNGIKKGFFNKQPINI